MNWAAFHKYFTPDGVPSGAEASVHPASLDVSAGRSALPGSCYFARRTRSTGFTFALFTIIVLAGCAPSEPRADLVIVNGAEPESLDPAIITGQPDSRVVLALFEGLTRFDPVTGKGVPGIAERWEISPDGRIYTFHLRSNAVWSTGEAITAHDFVYSWLRALDPVTAS